MKFGVGDTIIIQKPFIRMGKNHIGTTGMVTEIRSYGRGGVPTHYVVKFGCFKIPHIYMRGELEASCVCLTKDLTDRNDNEIPTGKEDYLRQQLRA